MAGKYRYRGKYAKKEEPLEFVSVKVGDIINDLPAYKIYGVRSADEVLKAIEENMMTIQRGLSEMRENMSAFIEEFVAAVEAIRRHQDET